METLELKTCSTCKIEQPHTSFGKNKSSKDGLTAACRACKVAYDKARYSQNKEEIKDRTRKYYTVNKERASISAKKYRVENKEQLQQRRLVYYENNKNEISRQRKKYYDANQEKLVLKRKNYYYKNKDEILIKQRIYTDNNKQLIKERFKKYYIENKEKFDKYNVENKEIIKERKKKYRSENKDAIREYNKNYDFSGYLKNRRKNDIPFRLSLIVRSRLHHALSGSLKNGSAVRDLGCSVAFLKQHLELQFTVGMTWDNWGAGPGNWNVDHIVPVTAFNLEDRQHFLLANHYGNLQPLWFEDNMYKFDKVPTWENYRTIHLYDKIAA